MTSSQNESGIQVHIKIGSDQFQVTLDNEPLVLGREVEDLPKKVLTLLEHDDYISRQHCQIWYEDSTDTICIVNLSVNGSSVNGNTLSKDEDCKLNPNSSIDLQVGKTRLLLVPQRVEVKLPKPIIKPIQENKDHVTAKMPITDAPSPAILDPVERATGNELPHVETRPEKSFFSFLPLFTSKGRYSRLDYFKVSCVIPWLIFISCGVFSWCLYLIGVDDFFGIPVVSILVVFLGLPFGTTISILAIIKRFHDMDRPGHHYWFLLIPFYNFYIIFILLFRKGTDGPNAFGSDPLDPDWTYYQRQEMG